MGGSSRDRTVLKKTRKEGGKPTQNLYVLRKNRQLGSVPRERTANKIHSRWSPKETVIGVQD